MFLSTLPEKAVTTSLSARRAWIEIDAIAVQAANSSGRSPQGERG